MSSCGTSVFIQSNVDLYKYFCEKQHFIEFPDLSFEPVDSDGLVDEYYVEYCNSSEIILQYSFHHGLLSYPFEETEQGTLIIYFAYPLLECRRRKDSALTCHAAGISIAGKGVVLFGKEGAGKTTLAINLCQKWGAKLIGNDLCVLGYKCRENPQLLGGTKYVHLRYESIKRNLPDKLHCFPDCAYSNDTWLRKIKVMPSDMGIVTQIDAVNISKFYFVHVDQTQPFFFTSAHTVSNILHLNENFSRYIRNTCAAIISSGTIVGYVPSFDDERDFENRVALINFIFKQDAEYLSGSIKAISNYIVEHV